MPLCRKRRLCWTLLFGMLGPFWVASPTAAQFQFEVRGAILPWGPVLGRYPVEAELTPAQIEEIPGTVQTRLEQAEALGAAGEWEEAIDTLLDVMAKQVSGLTEVSPDRFITLREYCQQRIARLPSAALEHYRGRVDATAEAWYAAGLSQRDRLRLSRVVDELFCSSFGDDALLALGDLTLEEGDYQAARWYWERISPLLRSPAGQPAWFALVGIDLDTHWAELAHAWQERETPPDWLAYPDTVLDIAEVRARLVLVSVREGNLPRAEFELELLRRWHPDAEGRLAGRSQPLAAALEEMIEGARSWPQLESPDDWPMFGGGPARNRRPPKLPRIAGPMWERPSSYVPATTDVRRTATASRGTNTTPSHQPLRYHPVVADDQVLFCGSRHVKAVDLATGRAGITDDGMLFRSPSTQRASQNLHPGFIPVTKDAVQENAHYTLSVYGSVVYARMGSPFTAGGINLPQVPAAIATDQAIVGLDLARDALLTFKSEPEDGAWAYEGAPLCDRTSLYVAGRHSDVKPRAHVACYDLATGRLRWRTPLCAADTPASGQRNEISNGLLTLVGDTIYFNTNLGAVAAVNKSDGEIRWIRRYDRAAPTTVGRPAPHDRRALAPCVYHEGVVMAAPTDTPLVFALDAATGKTLWVCEHADDAIDLIGVSDGNLIATGDRCRAIDARTGKLNFIWPESPQSGIVGRGRGCLAGTEVFWPTRRQIYVLDAATGAQSRPPIDISAYSEDGANLVAARGCLLVACSDQLIALGSKSPSTPSNDEQPLSWLIPGPTGVERARSHERRE